VRHDGRLFGFLWVIAKDDELTEREQATVVRVAAQLGHVLWRAEQAQEDRRRGQADALRRLLSSPGPDVRAVAADELADALDWTEGARVGVLVAHAATTDDAALAHLAERVRRRWDAGGLATLVDGRRLVLLVHLADERRLDDALAAALAAGAVRAAAGAPSRGLSAAHAAFGEACAADRLLERVPALGPAARWDQLGSWALLSQLAGAASPPAAPALARLLAHPSGVELAEAVEATLDHAGDVSAAAVALSMHRATLYRRLRRAEEITGLRLDRGDDRLVLHVGLRLWRMTSG
jgi:sugar diacid utilization regulator